MAGVLVLLASLGWASTARAASWLGPLDLGASTTSTLLDVAMNGSGDAAAVWAGPSGVVQAAVRPAGGLFSQPENVSPANTANPNPRIVISASGEVVVLWQQGPAPSKIQAAVRAPNGSFSAPQDVSVPGTNAINPEVAMSPTGDLVAIWESASGFLQSAVRPAGGVFSAPVPISVLNEGPFEAQVATDELGNAVAAWANLSNRTRAAIRPLGASFAGSSFAAPTNLSDGGDPSSRPQVALDRDGDAIVVWMKVKGGNTVVQGSIRPAGGQFPAPPGVDLSTALQDAFRPQVAMSRDGDGTAIWRTGGGTVEVATRGPGTAFGSPFGIGVAGAFTATIPQDVKMSAGGATIAVWETKSAGLPVVQGAARASGGGFSSPVNVSAPGGAGVPSPRVAADDAGDAVAVWVRNSVPQWAAYDGAGPQLRSLVIPASATAGAAVAFSVSPFDVFSGVGATTWSFGDGADATGPSVSHVYGAAGTYTVSVTATDGIGNSSTSSQAISVAAPPPPPPPPPSDADGDGSVTGFDCNDANPKIRPGAVDIPGNKIDENCDGRDARYPLLNATITLETARTLGSRAVTARRLTIRPVTKGSTVRLSCTGLGCHRFKTVTRKVAKSAGVRTFSSLLPKRKLTPGAKFEVRVTRSMTIGRVLRLTVFKSKNPTRTSLCLEPGKTKPAVCR